MKLATLLSNLNQYTIIGNSEQEVTSITNHSSQVTEGALFICISGLKTDGHHYAAEAIRRGAVALVTEKDIALDCTKIIVPNAREAQAFLSHAFFGNPSNQLEMIGITGTNGKTTTTFFIEAMLNTCGFPAGRIGTINYSYGGELFPTQHTTPDSIVLHKILADMKEVGTKSVVMEVSSHALELSRVAACDFDAAILTNITHDHFDFHKDFSSYLKAKVKLFELLNNGSAKQPFAVLNLDDPCVQLILDKCKTRVITYGTHKGSEVRAENINLNLQNSSFDLLVGPHRIRIDLKVPGLFNIYNALSAAAYGWGRNLDLQQVKKALESVTGVPGRCQRVELGQAFDLLVDFAHNPDGLKNILTYAPKPSGTRRVVVFGCEGGKDRTKRQVMGKIAGMHADYSIITMDNLYAEKPEEVAEQIEAGLLQLGKKPGKDYAKILDRYAAIKAAIDLAQPGDQVIIAGKGHETKQIIYDKITPFNDFEIASELVQNYLQQSPSQNGTREYFRIPS